MQNEEARTHFPLVQSLEQHSPFAAQELPAVLQELLSAAQAPAVQTPPQHAPLSVHACPSEAHWVPLQTPLTQLSDAQSVLALQFPPATTGLPNVDWQTCVAVSHAPEQQVLSFTHDSPAVPHVEPSGEPPSLALPPPVVVSVPWVLELPQPRAVNHAAQMNQHQRLLFMPCVVMVS